MADRCDREDALHLARLVRGDHPSPHSLLGIHKAAGGAGLVVRALDPAAESMFVLVGGANPDEARGGARRYPMMRIAGSPVFEREFPEAPGPFRYRLEARTAGGNEVREDPYRFAPTLGDLDLQLLGEGNHRELYRKMGAHPAVVDGVRGFSFALWAPSARAVALVGDFNGWDGGRNPMRAMGASGVWELFVPGVTPGQHYKFRLAAADGEVLDKTDPYAFAMEIRPKTASVTWDLSTYRWRDGAWMERRRTHDTYGSPMCIYEVHLGSWRRVTEEGNRWLTYGELERDLIPYVLEMGYTHIELLPPLEHPYDASWGYQVTGYFAPTSRHGTPDEFRSLVDACHRAGIGVFIDWVPAHFPADAHALARFDGTCLYEHADPRQGAHPDWGTLIFNYGRNEVRNFLLASALFWLEECHIDGLRVDAVSSMLYLDYSRQPGQWVPNERGGRENLEAIGFLRSLNETVYGLGTGAITIAEESTSWPAVSRPTYLQGLGFGYKWNMGWMHDMLEYFGSDPIFRRYHHGSLTFALLYAFHENFILALSHDEVVHGKGSMLGRMPNDFWQKFATLRALYGYQYAQPGKKLLFMGGEFGQVEEWNHDKSLSWHLLGHESHRGLLRFVGDLNRRYREEPALYEVDFDSAGFQWIDFSDSDNSIVSFIRRGIKPEDYLVCVFNFTPVPRVGYRLGLPEARRYEELLNSDSRHYGGGDLGNGGDVIAIPQPSHGLPASASLVLPPLSALYLKPA